VQKNKITHSRQTDKRTDTETDRRVYSYRKQSKTVTEHSSTDDSPSTKIPENIPQSYCHSCRSFTVVLCILTQHYWSSI